MRRRDGESFARFEPQQLWEKSNMAANAELFNKIRTALVDALGVDEEEVTPEATLVGDLGAESIDFLDIVFRLEKAFDIKIPRGELFPEDILTNTDTCRTARSRPKASAS